jgi:hypothetical protein
MRVRVRGVAFDNAGAVRVSVNGEPATFLRTAGQPSGGGFTDVAEVANASGNRLSGPGIGEWEVILTLPATSHPQLESMASDAADQREPAPHVVPLGSAQPRS